MERFWVEGVYLTRQGVRKRKDGKRSSVYIEPFARTFWANGPEEAARMATQALEGGEWIEGPKVSQTSEEQRMRAIGAPELPGFGAKKKRKG